MLSSLLGSMQPLQVDLLTLTLPYTTPYTLSSNQHSHIPNQNKMYMKKMRVNDTNEFPQSFSIFVSRKSSILCTNVAKFVAHAQPFELSFED
jgi:hypothetical protein